MGHSAQRKTENHSIYFPKGSQTFLHNGNTLAEEGHVKLIQWKSSDLYKGKVAGPCHLLPLFNLIIEQLLIHDDMPKGGDYASGFTMARSGTLFPPPGARQRQQWETESVHSSSHGVEGAHPGIPSAPETASALPITGCSTTALEHHHGSV